MQAIAPVSIVIPTYRRGSILLQTIDHLLAQQPRAAEILVVDQTERHDDADAVRLATLAGEGVIRWVRLDAPSIPRAMNAGLVHASHSVVLFLDDDIRPDPGLVAAHWEAHCRLPAGTLVAGRVLQPWQEGRDHSSETPFHFATLRARTVSEFIGCNFSVQRAQAIGIGGFDENFVRVAYRYEAEFAHRLLRSGGSIRFEPGACLHHLKIGGGGTRAFGEHLTTWRPDHAVGAYYYGLRTRHFEEFLLRPFRAVKTRYHLRHPWRIPGTLLAEVHGMTWALVLFIRGPALLDALRRGTP
jgi:GT2 family glycosyltransferase